MKMLVDDKMKVHINQFGQKYNSVYVLSGRASGNLSSISYTQVSMY